MTIAQHIAHLECNKQVLLSNRAFLIAVQSINAERSERIFTKGLNSAGGQIGTYNSTKPLYVNPKNSPKGFTPQGKNEEKSKKTAVQSIALNKKGGHSTRRVAIKQNFAPRSTKWFGSYKDFRSAIGRESGFVNLNLFGDMKSNFESARIKKISDSEYQIGLDGLNSKKKEGHEKKYGKVYEHTKDETDNFFMFLNKELQNDLSKC